MPDKRIVSHVQRQEGVKSTLLSYGMQRRDHLSWHKDGDLKSNSPYSIYPGGDSSKRNFRHFGYC